MANGNEITWTELLLYLLIVTPIIWFAHSCPEELIATFVFVAAQMHF